MNKEKRTEIMRILSEPDPHPKSELEFSNPFELLVAVSLSAQATDKSVNIATRPLFAAAPTPAAILELGEEKLKEYIRHVGLHHTKAKNIMALCAKLIDDFGGEVPADFDKLVSLPGVGKKTASVVLNVAFRIPRIAVDTHVFRVANRTGYAKGKTTDEVQAKMERLTPKEYLLEAHHYFIFHGRYVCKSRKPDCAGCSVRHLCEYKEKNDAE